MGADSTPLKDVVGKPETYPVPPGVLHRGVWSLSLHAGMLAATLALPSGGFQLSVTFRDDLWRYQP